MFAFHRYLAFLFVSWEVWKKIKMLDDVCSRKGPTWHSCCCPKVMTMIWIAMIQGRAMTENCLVVLAELGHMMRELLTSRMSHRPLSKTRSAHVLKVPGPMSIFKPCFFF